jgi:uncharacterized membrane protein HdeD (DUF308 family)
LGVFAFVRSQETVAALVLVFGAIALVDGAFVRLRHDITGEWWLALGGTASVVSGILLIRNPAAGPLAVLWLIGSYALAWGVMLTLGGFGVRRLHKQVSA